MNPSRTKILAKLLEVRKEVAYLQKEGRNTMQNYSFLAERQITEKFKELFDKHGIVFHYESGITNTMITPSGKQILTDVMVDYEFIDVASGESLRGRAAGQGTDANDKGVYKAITGAIKYIFMKSFLIPTGDDPEEDSREEKKVYKKKEQSNYGSSYGEEESIQTRKDVPFGSED